MTTVQKIVSSYWNNKLKGVLAVEADQLLSEQMHQVSVLVKEEDLSYFKQVTKGNYVAEFTVLLAVYNALLQRYFEDGELVSSNSMAPIQGTSLLYGFRSIRDKTLKQFLYEAKEEVQEVYKHRDYTGIAFQKLYTQFGYSYNKEEFCPAAFSLQVEYKTSQGMQLSLQCSDRIAEKKLAGHFLQKLHQWIKDLESILDTPVAKLAILSEAEKREQILPLGGDDATGLLDNKTIQQLFEEQVVSTPDAIALEYEGKVFTYRELNERANQLAHYLREERGISQTDFVGVKLARSEKLVISLLGVLKSGAAYVPMDISYPKERLAYIESDSSCKVVLDKHEWNRFQTNQAIHSVENGQQQKSPDDLAYIIYTSGTTGNPKGVMITHLNATAFINWCKEEFAKTDFEVVYAATSHCFDLSVFEIFYTLSVGKKVKMLHDALAIGEHLKKDTKVLLNTVPSSLRSLLDAEYDLTNVNAINLAGEPFPVDIAQRLLQYKAEVRNLYGPSEDTTYSTCYKLPDADRERYKSIPIGKPISNTQAYILDECLQLLPPGVVGKLYVSGAGVAKGYLNRPELTGQKFLANPFVEGDRMYDTGDMAKWLPDGNLEFLGRKDNQVKIRGYRIELEEIETVIIKFSSHIQQAAVAVKKVQVESVLVGYYVADAPVDKAQLRAYLQEQLPSYMVPNHVVEIEYIPLTPNGKVDKKALAGMTLTDAGKESYVPPRDKMEEELVAIWEEVIGVKEIGIEDNFFELGGHSLMISQMINRIRKRVDKSVPFKFFYTNPTIKSLRDSLKSQEFTRIERAPVGVSYPATPSQQRLWLLSQLEQGTKAYQITMAITIAGNIVVEDFVRAFTYVVGRHEILRTYFQHDENGVLQQGIVPESEFNFELQREDVSQSESPTQAVEAYIKAKNEQAYDLAKAPLFGASLLKTGTDQHVFFLSMHHIISDGWSLEVLTSEVMEAYAQLASGQALSLPALSIQFKDYAAWLAQSKRENAQQQAKEYWLTTFQGELPVLNLPSFTKRPLLKTYSGRMVSYSFSKKTLAQMKAFSKKHQATLFMMLMAGVKTLLSRYSNQKDIIVGTPVAGRDHQDLENQIGLYINTLAIRTQLEEPDSFIDLLKREKQILLQAYAHQHFSLDQLLGELTLTRDTSRSPLFDVMVVLQNQKQITRFQNRESIKDLKIDDFQIEVEAAQFDMSFVFVEDDSLTLNISYNPNVYEKAFVERIFTHLANLFNQVMIHPDVKLEAIDLLSSGEKRQLLFEFNGNEVEYPGDKTLIDLFTEQVNIRPEAPAIVFEGRTMTYRELHTRSNQLANYLLSRFNMAAEELIGVVLDRSEWSVISFLAVLKAGGVYVPIDPTYPQQRIAYILEDSKCKISINDALVQDFLKEESRSASAPEVPVRVNHLAYVVYTSGSTGNPKGVLIEHQGIVNTILAARDVLDGRAHKKGLQYASFCFDAAVFELFINLLSGTCLYIANEMERRDPGLLGTFIAENGIDLAVIFPAYLKLMDVDKLSGLKTLVTAGEAAAYEKTLEYLRSGTTTCFNGYGPTEVSVCNTLFKITRENVAASNNIPIGSPIPNTQAYILNNAHSLQPIGVIGEIGVGGAGLARGYLNRPELTDQKFIPHPFVEGERLYKTGDLGRWLPGGIIEFVGRKDDQVKVRGHRIELGEIESALLQSAQIANAVVLVKQTPHGENELVAYLISPVPQNAADVRAQLRNFLPDYMVPAQFVQVDEFPFTPSGKVDKMVLSALSGAPMLNNVSYVAPRNEIEKQLTLIWEEVLGVRNIGVTDDFFNAGGHSLKAATMLAKVNKTFGMNLHFALIFELRCIEELAVLIGNLLWDKEQVAEVQVIEKVTI